MSKDMFLLVSQRQGSPTSSNLLTRHRRTEFVCLRARSESVRSPPRPRPMMSVFDFSASV